MPPRVKPADDDVVPVLRPKDFLPLVQAQAAVVSEAKALNVRVPTYRELHKVKLRTRLVGRRGFWAAVALRGNAAGGATRPVGARTPRSCRLASRARARAPARSRSTGADDGDPEPPDLAVIPLRRFRRDVAAWLRGSL